MGTHIDVTVNGESEDEHMHEHHHHHNEHHHSKMADIEHIIHSLDISERVKENAVSVYQLIADMITGPSTKITNLGALKIVLGVKHFALYLIFVIFFALLPGLLVNVIV